MTWLRGVVDTTSEQGEGGEKGSMWTPMGLLLVIWPEAGLGGRFLCKTWNAPPFGGAGAMLGPRDVVTARELCVDNIESVGNMTAG